MNVETGMLGGQVPFIRGGSGTREAVVLPGGNALFRRFDRISKPGFYLRQVTRLLPQHRVTIAGYSAGNFDTIVQHLAEAIKKPIDVLVGISFGGFVSVRLAAQYPQLVRRLVLLITAHSFSSNGWSKMHSQVPALERGDFLKLALENTLLFRRPWYNWLLRVQLKMTRNRLAARLREPAAILEDYRALFGPEIEKNADYARRIGCPTLILGGTADQYFDAQVFEETAKMIPAAQLRLFERETHMLPIEKRRAVAAAISEFLRRSS
jgi:pimeloyl-ACP methyl ester carboxylesterase